MSSYTISLIIEAASKAEGPLKNLSKSLEDLGEVGAMATSMLGELYNAGQKLFEFGKLGATVEQTGTSFKRLGMDLGAMRAAVGGTVDDMTLMSSTLTLAAGASEELQGAFAGASGDLLRIAKAASALNPTLGDTTYMYESLALGIKRGSPMILDNLGLTISVSKANADYAKTLGKSADALTEEQKKIALLNATLEAGNRLIAQNGGNVDSATDGFVRLEAATTNLTNSMAQVASASGGFFDNLGQGVQGIANWQMALNMAREQGLNPFAAQLEVVREALGAENTVFDEARVVADAQRQAVQKQAAQARALADQQQQLTDLTRGLTVAYYENTYGTEAAIPASYNLAAAQRAVAEAAAAAQSAFVEGAAALGEYSIAQVATQQIDALRQAKESGLITEEKFVEAQQQVLVGFGLLTDEEIAAQGRLEALTQLYLSGAISSEEYAAKSLETKQALDVVAASEQEAATKAQELADKQTTAAEKAEAHRQALENAQGVLFNTAGNMKALGDAAGTASGQVETLRQKIAMLQDKIVTVTYRTVGTVEGTLENVKMAEQVEASRAAASQAQGMAAGFSGVFTRPTMAVFGEGGPERVTAQPLNNVTNYNLSVNAMAAASSVVQDFAMMRAFSGR